MNPRFRRFCLLLTVAAILAAFVPTSHAIGKETTPSITAISENGCSERLFFFGESTTAHLARRGGILDNPTDSKRVLRDESGTRMLDRRILSSPVCLTNENGTLQKYSFSDAVAALKPPCLVLSFGLNGIMGFVRSPDRFDDAYTHLIRGVRAVSPDTHVILQSIYPVRAATGFSVDVNTLNAHINRINEQIRQIAAREQVDFADTASVLRDRDGLLAEFFDAGDGIHLTNEAYRRILSYLGKVTFGKT
jgi:hypothetical protein